MMSKISKGISENKQKVVVKRLVQEFNFYWKFVCTDKNNDKNKTNLPAPASTPAIVFLITQKLISKLI